MHNDHSALISAVVRDGGSPARMQESTEPVPTLTPEEAVEILDLRVAKNKDLELEIRQLSAKVLFWIHF